MDPDGGEGDGKSDEAKGGQCGEQSGEGVVKMSATRRFAGLSRHGELR
jgi:hypothetical protein